MADTAPLLAAPQVPDYVQELAAAEKEALAQLCELDDQYLGLSEELRKELVAVKKRFVDKLQPLLNTRKELLVTKPLPHFWLRVLEHSHVAELIEDHDHPCLERLRDVTCEDNADPDTGFKLHLHFAANEFFTNEVLTKTYHTKRESKWDADLEYFKVEATKVEWKEGQDLTLEQTTKGKGKKKKTVFKPRESFFRFFTPLGEGAELPPLIPDSDDDSDEEDEAERMDSLINEDVTMAEAFRNLIIPHAVRHYTQEAVEMESDDEDAEPTDSEDDTDFETPQKTKPPVAAKRK